MALSEVRTIDDVWFWIQHGFLPVVWAEARNYGPVNLAGMLGASKDVPVATSDKSADAGSLRRQNKIIAGVRLRQWRFEDMDCQVREELQSFYEQKCHSERYSTASYG